MIFLRHISLYIFTLSTLIIADNILFNRYVSYHFYFNFLVSFLVRVFQHPHSDNNSSFLLLSFSPPLPHPSSSFCAFASQIFNKFRRAEIAKHSASWVELFVRFAGRRKKNKTRREKLLPTHLHPLPPPKSSANRFLGDGHGQGGGVATKALQRRQNKKFSRCLHNKGSPWLWKGAGSGRTGVTEGWGVRVGSGCGWPVNLCIGI